MFGKLLCNMLNSFSRRNGLPEEGLKRLKFLLTQPKELTYDYVWRLAKDWRKEEFRSLYNGVMSLPDRDAGCFLEELSFLKTLKFEDFVSLPVYAYSKCREFPEVEPSFDAQKKLPFVIHNGKKLFFKKCMSLDSVRELYVTYMYKEGITGNGCLMKSPHCYCTDQFKVERGDVVLDVGSAEGMFALDSVDNASHVYVFEGERAWAEANQATFEPFSEKTTVIGKYVGDKTNAQYVKLDDALMKESEKACYFIKMDIEGAERIVLNSSLDFLKNHRTKIACTVYHRPDDAVCIRQILESNGFKTEFSEGYTLIDMGGAVYPYFRKCLIRAKNY